MKIGILTFHDGINHGGFFQAYSTYSFLISKGYDVEIINYKNKIHWFFEYKNFLLTKNPFKLMSNLKKIISFKKAQRRMNLKPLCKNVNEIKEHYDVVIVGSDIVWNYEWDFLGNDDVYFGNGINSKRWVSYAPSFGAVDYETTEIPKYVINGLKNFSHISVRDSNSQNIVKKASGRNASLVLDPTFLLDTNGMENEIKINDKFLLIYAYMKSDKDIKYIKQFAKERGLKIIAIGYKIVEADYNFAAVGPFEWIAYFKKADFVVTSTFHGTLYSIKYKKEFVTIANINILNKTKTILKNLGLENRLVNSFTDFLDCEYQPINYEVVDSKLLPFVENSERFLIEAIENDN